MLMTHTWRAEFPGLAGISGKVSDVLDNQVRRTRRPAGAVVFGPGHPADNLLLLAAGTVRVQRLSKAGRESVLYRVSAGESCVLTTACLLASEDYAVEGVAETDVEAMLIPRAAFDELMSVSKEFRAFVFAAYSKRIADLFMGVEENVVKRMDIRVAQKLVELQDTHAAVVLTHQRLAIELGTAREVILRQLKEFERRGWLTLRQGGIEFRDCAAINRLAHAS